MPESSGSDARSPSEWEKGSESDDAAGVGASVRPVLDGALAGLRGSGPLSSEDLRLQKEIAAKEGRSSTQPSRPTRICQRGAGDIGTIQEVQTSKMCLALCAFLESYSSRSTRIVVSHADAERAWKACRGGTGDLRVVLGELVDARRRAGVVSTARELEVYEKDFMDRFGSSFRKHLAFECSMLQTAEKGSRGV